MDKVAALEAMKQIANSSATVYVDGITNGGVHPSVVTTHRAFVDGFLTAIELLLTDHDQVVR